VHLVRYLRAQEALFDQVTLDLIATRRTLALLTLVSSEAAPTIDTMIVLLGRPVEPPRSAPVTHLGNAFVSPEELRRLLVIFSNRTIATTPRVGHHRYPNPEAPHSTPANSDVEAPGEASTSARHARLDVDEVD
jgi:hypothetical protein